MTTVLTTTNLPGVERVASGKVRDVYKVDDDLLIVATDRISAFDCILPQGIPGKGRVLTQMSLFWFDLLHGVIPNHLITADVDAYPPQLLAHRDQLEGRSMQQYVLLLLAWIDYVLLLPGVPVSRERLGHQHPLGIHRRLRNAERTPLLPAGP